MSEERDAYLEYSHQLELEKRALATGAVACAREALRIATEVDAGRIPRNRATAVLRGCLGMGDTEARHLLEAKPVRTGASSPVPEGALVPAVQQAIAFTGPPEEARLLLTTALAEFLRTNKAPAEG